MTTDRVSKSVRLHTQHAVIACAVLVLFGCAGCARETRVLRTKDTDGADMDDFGNPSKPVLDSGAGGVSGDAGFLPRTSFVGRPAPPGFEPPKVLSTKWVDRDTCSDEPTEILTELRDIYGLAVTSSRIYVATHDGVVRSGRDGSDPEWVVDDYVPRVLADEHALYWSNGSLDLRVQGEDGEDSVFLSSTGAIEGVSQDDDSIYAMPFEGLVRVSKRTKAVTELLAAPLGRPEPSGTAVDDAFVYFVGTADEGGYDLERVNKGGGDREHVAPIPALTVPETLLVDGSYVYVAGDNGIVRVALAGDAANLLVDVPGLFGQTSPLAQDDRCLYYVENHDGGGELICLTKSDGSREQLLELEDGGFSALAKVGSDLYFGAYRSDPSLKQNWVGRITCQDGP